MKKSVLMFAVSVVLSGCAATLPDKISIDSGFSTAGIKSASVKMECSDVKSDNVDPASIPDFCQMLHAAAKSSIRKKSGFKITDDQADVEINIKLEEVYGGSAAARFWVGMGAGRSAITTYVSMFKGGKILAEGRLIETSTMPNIVGSAWSNDEIIKQDIGILGGKIADFVVDPRSFEPKPEKTAYTQ